MGYFLARGWGVSAACVGRGGACQLGGTSATGSGGGMPPYVGCVLSAFAGVFPYPCSVFPYPCSLFRYPCSIFPVTVVPFTECSDIVFPTLEGSSSECSGTVGNTELGSCCPTCPPCCPGCPYLWEFMIEDERIVKPLMASIKTCKKFYTCVRHVLPWMPCRSHWAGENHIRLTKFSKCAGMMRHHFYKYRYIQTAVLCLRPMHEYFPFVFKISRLRLEYSSTNFLGNVFHCTHYVIHFVLIRNICTVNSKLFKSSLSNQFSAWNSAWSKMFRGKNTVKCSIQFILFVWRRNLCKPKIKLPGTTSWVYPK